MEDSYSRLLRDHYREESRLVLLTLTCREYIQKCVGILDFEVEIAERFLPESVEDVMEVYFDHRSLKGPAFRIQNF